MNIQFKPKHTATNTYVRFEHVDLKRLKAVAEAQALSCRKLYGFSPSLP
jgi:hypothetical protein